MGGLPGGGTPTGGAAATTGAWAGGVRSGNGMVCDPFRRGLATINGACVVGAAAPAFGIPVLTRGPSAAGAGATSEVGGGATEADVAGGAGDATRKGWMTPETGAAPGAAATVSGSP